MYQPLIVMAYDTVEKAQRRAVTPADAELIWRRYCYDRDMRDFREHSDASDSPAFRVNVAKVRVFIRFGIRYPDNATEIFDRALAVYRRLDARLRVTNAYSALLMVARAHIGRPLPMTDDELTRLFVNE